MPDKDLSILLPMLGMVALTFGVYLTLYRTRIGEMRRRRVNPQKFRTRQDAAGLLENTSNSDNLINLFELPVLFYVAVLVIWQLQITDLLYLVLAWTYLGLRILHSAIHITYNRVIHRFYVHLISNGVLLLLWLRIGVEIVAAL